MHTAMVPNTEMILMQWDALTLPRVLYEQQQWHLTHCAGALRGCGFSC